MLRILSLLLLMTLPQYLQAAHKGDGHITLKNLHLNEIIKVQYRRPNGSIDDKAMAQIEHGLRCRMTHHVHEIPVALIELLDEIQDHFGVQQVEVISGYRSPEFNDTLKKRGRAVATKSLHMEGIAIDIRLPGIATARVRDFAIDLNRGGVGYYQENDFVHVDLGRVRYW